MTSKFARTVAIAALLSLGGQASSLGDWLLPRGNAQLNPVLSSHIRHFQWQFVIPGGSDSTPVVDGDTVFVAGKNDQLYALHLYTGTLEWTRDLGNQILSVPLVDRGIVLGSAGNLVPNGATIGGGVSSLVGLDEATGNQLWWYGLDGTGASSGAVVAGYFLHHDGAGNIVALDPRTGALIWKSSAGTHAALSAITPIEGSRVVTAGSNPNAVIALNAANGHIVWRCEFTPDSLGIADVPLATDANNVYGVYLVPDGAGKWAEHAYALNASNGNRIWDIKLQSGSPTDKPGIGVIPLVDNRHVYVGSTVGPYMNAVDKTTGKLVWTTRVHGMAAGGSVAKDGAVYFGDTAGYLWALRTVSGKPIGHTAMGDAFDRAAPIIVGETLLITSRTGYIFAEPLQLIRTSSGS